MNEYVIFTDSGCDISRPVLQEWGVACVDLLVTFVGSTTLYKDTELDPKAFYERMRQGEMAKTSAINTETFRTAFEEHAKAGKDIIYLGFSSGLSTTFHCAQMALKELAAQYPSQTFIAEDSLCASGGQGLLLYSLVKMKEAGATVEELSSFVQKRRLHLCHWFTVDDLEYLKRGGRVSPTVAFVGNLLGIKPVLHVDNEGHLINVSKVRGRKAAIKALADKLGELGEDLKSSPVFISHGDCEADAQLLADMVKERFGVSVDRIVDIGAVIGSHSGPGTLAIFFYGKER